MRSTLKALIGIALIIGMMNVAPAQEKHGVGRVSDLEVDIWVNKGHGSTYYYGEDVAVYFRANADCYVVVYDIDPSGNVSLIYPSEYGAATFVEGGEVYRIPDDIDDYRLEVTGPSGEEYIYAVASYYPIEAPDFIRYEFFEYGDWDSYYDDFIHSVRGERSAFAADLNMRIAGPEHVSSTTMFFIDVKYRHHRWYRHWRYDPYYIGSVWIGADYPGCEVWIDGIYYGIAPIYVPEIYIGRHWIWIYYNGYPCWQDYVHIRYGHRHHVNAKIGRRYRDFQYGRGHLSDFRFKYEKHLNEEGFKHKADRVRQERTRPRPAAPLNIVKKHSRLGQVPDYSSRTEQKSSRTAASIQRKRSDNQGTGDRQTGLKANEKSKKSLNIEDQKTIIKGKEDKAKKSGSTKIKSQTTSKSTGNVKKGSSNTKREKGTTSKGRVEPKRGK